MNMWRVGEDIGSKEMDGCPLTPWTSPFLQVCSEIFSLDCWKLSIPAILYVVQNSLQFVAISNLPMASCAVFKGSVVNPVNKVEKEADIDRKVSIRIIHIFLYYDPLWPDLSLWCHPGFLTRSNAR
jgi:hypothetical protein